jgi:hypothetical protein
MQRLVKTFAARFKEPSSWAGLATMLGTLGINAPAPVITYASFIGAGVCGLVAFFLPDA